MNALERDLLLTFLNSHGPGDVTDWLQMPERAARWLAGAGSTGPNRRAPAVGAILARVATAGPPTADELTTSRAIRDALRALIEDKAAPPLDLVTPVRLQLRDGRVVLEPAADGLLGLAVRALVAAHDAQQDGSWARLGVCRNARCSWVFLDSSRNRSRAWCDMAACGARQKMRAYRARRNASPAAAPPTAES
ncbi:MAG: CGNR zinc finger domain-containing protein [Dehalococcoidia bacterium]